MNFRLISKRRVLGKRLDSQDFDSYLELALETVAAEPTAC